MSPLSTPSTITPFILDCAAKISTNPPRFVDLVAYPGMEVAMCFENVERLVEARGGRAIMGWIFWEWPKVIIDAEHHAIWERSDGVLEDVTPKAHGERRILFVRDDLALYSDSRALNSKRFPAPGNELAREFVALKEEADEMIYPYRQTGAYFLSAHVQDEYHLKEVRARLYWDQLVMKHGKRNSMFKECIRWISGILPRCQKSR